MEDLSHTVTGGISGGDSMSATNGVSEQPPFSAPGSVSEATTPPVFNLERHPGPDIPAQAGAHIAGPGDRGGLVRGEPGGEVVGSWTSVDNVSSPGWTGTTAGTARHGH